VPHQYLIQHYFQRARRFNCSGIRYRTTKYRIDRSHFNLFPSYVTRFGGEIQKRHRRANEMRSNEWLDGRSMVTANVTGVARMRSSAECHNTRAELPRRKAVDRSSFTA